LGFSYVAVITVDSRAELSRSRDNRVAGERRGSVDVGMMLNRDEICPVPTTSTPVLWTELRCSRGRYRTQHPGPVPPDNLDRVSEVILGQFRLRGVHAGELTPERFADGRGFWKPTAYIVSADRGGDLRGSQLLC
jgi:hypothetical protein